MSWANPLCAVLRLRLCGTAISIRCRGTGNRGVLHFWVVSYIWLDELADSELSQPPTQNEVKWIIIQSHEYLGMSRLNNNYLSQHWVIWMAPIRVHVDFESTIHTRGDINFHIRPEERSTLDQSKANFETTNDQTKTYILAQFCPRISKVPFIST